jgi:DNA-binding MarR family transcriptional regulator
MRRKEPTILRFISILYRYSHMHIARRLQPYGLASGQHPFLLAVCRHPGFSQEKLSEHLVIDKGTTAKAVKALEKGGWIERRVDEADRRMYRLFATKQGQELGSRLDDILLKWQEVLFAGFSPTEKEEAFDLVKRMAENARSAAKYSPED